MAPLLSLLLALALSTAVLASPHAPRGVYNHRAVAKILDVRLDSPPLPLPKRKRSLNKRCLPRPSNGTTPASPTSAPPLNVAPEPSSSAPHSETPSSSPSPSYSPSPSSSQSSSSSPPPVNSPTPTPTPTPSSTSTPPPASTPTPTPTPSQGPSSSDTSTEPGFLVGTQYGQGTYYSTGLGACGITNNDSQYIAAVSHLLFDAYPGYNGADPNTNPVCGKSVVVSYGQKTVTVVITDRCEGCALTDLDFSPAAFNTLASASVGRINLNWVWKG